MSTAVKASKPNIGVFTNPEHNLWIDDAAPSLEAVQTTSELREGQVTIAVRSTGICGYVFFGVFLDLLHLQPLYISPVR